jgi:hypothetical protein
MKLNIIFIAAALAYASSAVLALPVDSQFVTRDLADFDDFDAREVSDADLDAREFDEEIFEREPKSTLDPLPQNLDSDLPPSTKSKSKAVESDHEDSTLKPKKKKKSLLSRMRSKKSKSKSKKSLSTTDAKHKKKKSSLFSRLRSKKKSTPKKKKLSLRQRLARRRRNIKARARAKKARLSKLKAEKAKKSKTTHDDSLKKSKVAAETPTNVDDVYTPPRHKSHASLD